MILRWCFRFVSTRNDGTCQNLGWYSVGNKVGNNTRTTGKTRQQEARICLSSKDEVLWR